MHFNTEQNNNQNLKTLCMGSTAKWKSQGKKLMKWKIDKCHLNKFNKKNEQRI